MTRTTGHLGRICLIVYRMRLMVLNPNYKSPSSCSSLYLLCLGVPLLIIHRPPAFTQSHSLISSYTHGTSMALRKKTRMARYTLRSRPVTTSTRLWTRGLNFGLGVGISLCRGRASWWFRGLGYGMGDGISLMGSILRFMAYMPML